MNPTPNQRRTYDEPFKRDAVALLESGRKAAQLARDLGISAWNLRDWKRLNGPGAVAAVQRELASLRRQNDILKKALAIVSQQDAPDSSSSTPFAKTPRP
jgi:transposase